MDVDSENPEGADRVLRGVVNTLFQWGYYVGRRAGFAAGVAYEKQREGRLGSSPSYATEASESGPRLPLDTQIMNLAGRDAMTNRAKLALVRVGLFTIADVLFAADRGELRAPNFGPVSLEIMRRELRDAGYILGQ